MPGIITILFWFGVFSLGKQHHRCWEVLPRSFAETKGTIFALWNLTKKKYNLLFYAVKQGRHPARAGTQASPSEKKNWAVGKTGVKRGHTAECQQTCCVGNTGCSKLPQIFGFFSSCFFNLKECTINRLKMCNVQISVTVKDEIRTEDGGQFHRVVVDSQSGETLR